MNARDSNTAYDPSPEEEEEGFDAERLKETLGFVMRAPSRRPKLALGVFLVISIVGIVIAITMPRTYNAQVRFLVQRNVVLSQLTTGFSSRDESSTKGIPDMILKRDNLVALVKEANLVDRFDSLRSPSLRMKDKIQELVGGKISEADRLRGLVATLEKKLTVTADDQSVTINCDWDNAEMAYELVSIVQRNFLDAKYDTDVAMVTESIAILQDHSKAENEQVDAALSALVQVQLEKAAAARAAQGPATVQPQPAAAGSWRPRPAPGGSASAAALPPADATLTRALEEKRKQIRSLEDERARTIDSLKQQLSQAQITLTPLHPTVQAIEQRLALAKEPSPELEQLHAEERTLMAQIAPPVAPSTPAPMPDPTPNLAQRPIAPQPPQRAPAPIPTPTASVGPNGIPVNLPSMYDEDGPTRLARSHLESAIHRYQEVLSRIDAAKIQLELSKTAFKYRFTVSTPPEVPRKPKKPIAPLLGVGSLVAAILFGIVSAAAADFLAGRVIEPWQVRRHLKIEVLGEFEPPA